MRTLILVAVFSAFGLSTALALSTTLGTTVETVKGNCQGKESGCWTPCGSTTCNYKCDGGNCTVTIERVTGKSGGPTP
jgi:hypothetical protein